MKTALIIILIGLASSAWAANREEECMIATFTDYNRANVELLTKTDPVTVETIIAQRRLQEQYCLRIAQCHVAGPPPQRTSIALNATFSSCLRDEAMEKYELVPATGK